MNDIFAEIMDDVAEASISVPKDKDLEGVAKLVQEQITLEDRIANGEAYLKQLKEELTLVRTLKLPEALDELGLRGLPMADGAEVVIEPFVGASISKANKEEAHGWLKDNGHGDIIKHVISVNVGRDDEAAVTAVEALRNVGLAPDDSESVHSGTLKAWVKEQVAAGTPIPLPLFGAFLGQKATIKRGKK